MPLFGPPNVDKLGRKADVRGLIKALAYRHDEQVRAGAAQALVALKDGRALQPLIQALSDRAPAVVCNAASALAALADRSAVAPLIARLESALQENSAAERQVQQALAAALGELGDRAAIEPLRRLLHSDNPALRRTAEFGLDRLGVGPDAQHWIGLRQWERCAQIGIAAVEPLIEALEQDALRQGASAALAQIGAPAVPGLIGLLPQRRAADVLLRIGRPALPALVSALGDLKRRESVAMLLGELGDLAAVQPLLDQLEAELPGRAALLAALAKLGDRRALQPLLNELRSGEPQLKLLAATAIGALADPAAVDALAALLEGDDPDLAVESCRSLGRIRDRRALPALIAALERPHLEEAAATALGEIGDPAALEPLRRAVEQTPEHIFSPAREPFERLLKLTRS